MRDDFHDYSADPHAQKSVTDWLMQVIARKQDAVLHEEASHEKKHPEAKLQPVVAVQEPAASEPAATVNGSNGAALTNGHASISANGHTAPVASPNGNSYSAPSQNGLAAPSQNGHNLAPVSDVFGDVFGDVFSDNSQNGNGSAASQDGHSAEPPQEVYEFSADDLCGPPAFGRVPVVSREEVTADDLCFVPKPQVIESFRNGNGHYEPAAAYPMPSFEPAVAQMTEPTMAAPVTDFSEQMFAAPAFSEPLVIAPEPQIIEEPHSFVPEPQVIEAQPSAAAEVLPVAEPAAVTTPEPTTTPEQWHEQMMAMAKATPEAQAVEAEVSASAEPEPAAEDQWEPIRAADLMPVPEVIPPEPKEIDATPMASAEGVAVAEASAASEFVAEPQVTAMPEIEGTVSPAVEGPQAQIAEPTSGATGEQTTNLVPVERRKRKRPAVSIADICRDWVIEEMEANGGVPEPQEVGEEDFLSEEDSIVQTPESVFAHEGIWGNTAAPGAMGENGQPLPNIPEIESGAVAQGKAKTSSSMKALLRLGTLLPWLAREMEAGNDQNAALTQEVRHEVSGMRLVQYEIRSTVHDHSLQLKRVEEQLTRVREAVTAEQSGTADLVESVKSTTKVVSMVGVGICVMLVAILGLVMFMVMHGR